jgi:hypothetical protein
MVKINDTLFCDGCGIEITCKPFTLSSWVYCCEDCATGKPCTCENRLEIDEERHNPYPEMPS